MLRQHETMEHGPRVCICVPHEGCSFTPMRWKTGDWRATVAEGACEAAQWQEDRRGKIRDQDSRNVRSFPGVVRNEVAVLTCDATTTMSII